MDRASGGGQFDRVHIIIVASQAIRPIADEADVTDDPRVKDERRTRRRSGQFYPGRLRTQPLDQSQRTHHINDCDPDLENS